MYRILFTFFIALAPFAATGQTDSLPIPVAVATQTDSLPAPAINIAQCRQNLHRAFARNDRPDVQYWLDSLRRLEDDRYLALYWDERWLLYLWLENYAPLLLEVAQHNSLAETLEMYKLPPPKDSLFDLLDTRMYEDRLYLFDQVRKGWLTAEERAFSALLVNYLLRLSVEEADKRRSMPNWTAF
ncbi:MAG: hypothetical protein IPM98_00610 [Lewinellaceae bacterium]|nr:hypothetical protein [Lewinellaceae bacterium]